MDGNAGKTVVVTGSSGGVGRAAAIEFGRNGANVVQVNGDAGYYARTGTKAQAIATALGAQR